MTWRRAWGYVAVFLALTVLQILTTRHTDPPDVREETALPLAATPVPFLAAKPDDIDAVEIEVGGQSADIKRRDARWEVVRPAGREVSPGLISALLTAVLDVPEVEVVGSTDDRDFGMDAPVAELRLHRAGRPPITIRFGALNPARTAIYASGSGTRQVVLLGLNVRYYLDLVAEAVFRRS